MRRGALVVAAVAATALVGSLPATAGATPVSALLTGVNGCGSFNDRLDCGAEGGAGDTWRYDWQDQLASDGTRRARRPLERCLRGPPRGSAGAFVPAGDGHLALTVAAPGGRSGTRALRHRGRRLVRGRGAHADARSSPTIRRAQQVSGSLPIVATGGLGALRGLTGSGTADLTLELTPGADNAASIALAGDLDVPDPAISVASGSARWANLTPACSTS